MSGSGDDAAAADGGAIDSAGGGADGAPDGPDGSDGSMDASGTADASPADAGPPPIIHSFTAPTFACPGSQIQLGYDFANGAGAITPGAIAVAPGTGQVPVAFATMTTYTLTVTGPGGPPAIAHATVTDVAPPNTAITAPPTVRQGDRSVLAAIPDQPSGVAITWSVPSANATITSGAGTSHIAFDVTGDGDSVVLQVTATDPLTGCATTSTRTLRMRCRVPVLLSTDRAAANAPQYGSNNEDVRPFALNASGTLWTSWFVQKPAWSGFAVYDATFQRAVTGALSYPASAPLFLNDAASASRVFDVKVATDDAGDAVFAWVQTVDNSTYSAVLRSYRASDDSWGPEQVVAANVINAATPVHVALDHASGQAVIGTIQGPYGNAIPHLRSYDLATRTLGADLPLRVGAANTNSLDPTQMDFDLELNGTRDGIATWFELDPAGVYALYALHITAGVPDGPAGAYDIQKLAAGSSTYVDDVLNYNSPRSAYPEYQLHMGAVSASGNAAVMWRVYNGMATGAVKGTLYARRYLGGAWGPLEVVDTAPDSGWYRWDLTIDDAGDMLAVTLGFADERFLHGQAQAAWAAPTILVTLSTGGNAPHVTADSASGRGFVTYQDPSQLRGPLKGMFYDPVTQALSAPFTVDDPTQSGIQVGRAVLDAAGTATVVYTQMPAVLPPGANSARSALQYLVTCE